MAATRKVGTQLLVRPETKVRAQRLAVLREESQAETLRVLVDQALPRMERAYGGRMEDMAAAFRHMKIAEETALPLMLEHKIKYADLFQADGSPKDHFPIGDRA